MKTDDMTARRLAVLNGSWKFPANDQVYSQGFRDLISAMMVLNPASRPDLHKVGPAKRNVYNADDRDR